MSLRQKRVDYLGAVHDFQNKDSVGNTFLLRAKFAGYIEYLNIDALAPEDEDALRQTLPVVVPAFYEKQMNLSIGSEIQLAYFFTRNNTYQTLLDLPDGAVFLTWHVTQLAALMQTLAYPDFRNVVGTLIHQWTGETLPEPRRPTPESVIDCLYGKGVYGLYVDEDTFHENIKTVATTLPLLHAAKATASNAATLTLPTDLST